MKAVTLLFAVLPPLLSKREACQLAQKLPVEVAEVANCQINLFRCLPATRHPEAYDCLTSFTNSCSAVATNLLSNRHIPGDRANLQATFANQGSCPGRVAVANAGFG